MFNFDWRNRARKIRDRNTDKALVLMYHRIAELSADPWQLAVSPENFERQLQFLKKNYKLISVEDLIKKIREKTVSPRSVCLTFDDGYLDNYSAAKPLLEKYECPAAFFISTYYVDRQECFWWDELQELILNSAELPSKLSINAGENSFSFELEKNRILTDEERKLHRTWVWYHEPPTKRCELYLKIYNRLKPFSHNEIHAALKQVKHSIIGTKPSMELYLPMTVSQLKEITENSLFDVGNHTVTHPDLKFHPTERQFEEISDCKIYLEANCKKSVNVLAYPHGEFNKETLAVVKKLGLNGAFSTVQQPVTRRSDIYRLGRFQVNNWNADEFESHLAKWEKDY